MSAPRRPPSPTEATTLVTQPPVHVRRWTSRPRAVAAALRGWTSLVALTQRLGARVGAVVAVAVAHVGSRFGALALLAGAQLLARRRQAALRDLGQAAYDGDEDSVERRRAHVAALDAEIVRRRHEAAALRAGAREQARQALAAARATEIREPGPSPPTPVPEPGPVPAPEPPPQPDTLPVPPRVPDPTPEPPEPPAPPGSP